MSHIFDKLGPLELAARELAEQLRKRHSIAHYPMPVKRLAEEEGARIQYAHILSEGSLCQTQGDYVLRVKASSHPFRQRFTIAHELGHLILDQLAGSCTGPHYRLLIGCDDLKAEERFCDCFAAYLLMPDDAIAELVDWSSITITKIIRKAYDELEVSISSLVRRVLEQIPYNGGALWFSNMGKPSDANDVKLRLNWGIFPKSENIYLPRYASVPENCPIHQAAKSSKDILLQDVKLNFANLRGERSLLIRSVGKATLALVLPDEIDPRSLLSTQQMLIDSE
jgi:Zn-dependent peptidase ImmA (M78 family)